MKVLVTGSKGQLGYEIMNMLNEKEDVVGIDIETLDITDSKNCYQYITSLQPDVVIHTAAYTNVDGCESNADLAYRVNVIGTQNIASACLACDAKMIYISTDFVFDGKKNDPYDEFDDPNPISIYGRSKLAGEKMVQSILNKYFIVRTAWLYGLNGNNFVKTMLRLAKEKDEISVVNDQWGTPTYTKDLSQVICKLLYTNNYGIYHGSNKGSCTWYDFAKKIFELAEMKNIIVKPITTEDLGRPAKRPKYSVLRNYMLELTIGDSFRQWESSLEEYISELRVSKVLA